MSPWLLLAAMMLAPLRAAAEPARHFELQPLSVEGCEELPHPDGFRDLWVGAEESVDEHARYWTVDRPSHFAHGLASVRYRIGSGVLRVDAALDPPFVLETVQLQVERSIEPSHLAAYLPKLTLPCTRVVRYAVRDLGSADANVAALARFDAALHEAAELLYDQAWGAAGARLEEARRLRPADPAPYWMLARLRFLEIEAGDPDLPRDVRIQAYREAESLADEAVARAPERAEGYLWQGIARGRIASSLGNVRLAVQGALGGRGPAWLEQTLHRAASLQPDYRFFGEATRADALHALAQFYRLAPDSWYMLAVGTRGDIDRSVSLSREAVSLLPRRIDYRVELGVALLCRDREGDAVQAKQEFERALALPPITRLDRLDQVAVRRLLRGGENPCWYSRDAARQGAS